ncbi:MAG: sodium-dependent transporter [Rhizobiales bacterium TMED83]|nr:MAG: sodium-dependent transporter [Rhizobiales bacterium TMED83]
MPAARTGFCESCRLTFTPEFNKKTTGSGIGEEMSSSENQMPAWASQSGFVFACIGAAVGLGNIWKFPYMTGVQGGGAFVLIYLASIFAIAIPIAAAELVIGRQGRSDAQQAVKNIALASGRSARFAAIGTLGVLGSFILLTFYAVIAGWVTAYIVRALTGALNGLDAASASNLLAGLHAAPGEMIAHQILFLAVIGLILIRKLNAGLERANLVLIPALIVMLIGIAIYGAVAGDVGAALVFLFTPDFSKITPETIQSAVGHGFFSVGVGAAMLITYGAYLDRQVDLAKAAITIGIADTIIALIAGIGVFAIVFGEGLDPTGGPGLIFTTLPLAFSQLPGGSALAVIFFTLVFFAALTSGLSLSEVIIRWAENTFGLSRVKAAILMLGASFGVGLASVFSFNIWSQVHLFDAGALAGKTLFDVKDYFVTALVMPVCGLGVVAFASWVAPAPMMRAAMGSSALIFNLWLWSARIIAPAGIGWMLWAGL